MNTLSKKTILLIDDHELFRAGLRMILQLHVDANIIEIEKISDINSSMGNVDVILLDICLPGLNGLDGMSILQRHWPNARIMLLSAMSRHKDINKALENGASCYLNKNSAPQIICDTVNSLLRRYRPKNLEIKSDNAASGGEVKAMLSPRQLEVLTLVAEGEGNKIIAEKLNVSEHTVRNHIVALMRHFHVSNRTQIILAAQRAGYLSS